MNNIEFLFGIIVVVAISVIFFSKIIGGRVTRDLYDLADQVETERDFLNFLKALMNDWDGDEQREDSGRAYTSGPYGWENVRISTFLDAALAWGEATIEDSTSASQPENPWKRAAHILHAGKFYE
ncbi:hypothetical protein [Microbulbifer elongatus]|uniref:DUF7660 family protein n=1 Tax=Microbulbifer elongatus TaxID=86173 RepID=UPI001CFD9B6F|nr:hypothetical protein [Microbulbifer elongatus]